MARRKHVVVKKKVVKKKAARKKAAGARQTGPVPVASGPSDFRKRRERAAKAAAGGGFGVGSIIMLVVALAMIVFVLFIFWPVDLNHVKGYPFDPAKAPDPPQNLLREVHDKLVAKVKSSPDKPAGESLTFSEKEVNTYLNQRLRQRQTGLLANLIKPAGTYADLKEDEITVYIVRRILGMPFTISATVAFYEKNLAVESSSVGKFHLQGAAFGPIWSPFRRLAGSLSEEAKLLKDEDVRRIKVGEDSISVSF